MWTRIAKGVILGLVAAVIVSVVCALLSATVAGYSWQPLEAAPWLFAVSAVPSAISGALLATSRFRDRGSPKRAWLVSTAIAFAAAVLSGSVGAVAVESAQRGIQQVNVRGYFGWCWVYAFALLPVTAPMARGATRMLWQQNS